jgi:hypothetical protein
MNFCKFQSTFSGKNFKIQKCSHSIKWQHFSQVAEKQLYSRKGGVTKAWEDGEIIILNFLQTLTRIFII